MSAGNEVIELDSDTEVNFNANAAETNNNSNSVVDLSSDNEDEIVLPDNTDDEVSEIQTGSKQEIILTDDSDIEGEPVESDGKVIALDDDDDEGDATELSTNEEQSEEIPKEIVEEAKNESESSTAENRPEQSTMDDKQETELTPQQVLRKQMAAAAEKRMKSNSSENFYEALKESEPPSKKQKVDEKPSANIPIPNPARLPRQIVNDKASRIRMIANPSYCAEFGVDGDRDAVSLSDMVGSKDLLKTYQFNMLIDFEYLSKFINCKDCEFVLVNKNHPDFLFVNDSSWDKWNISTIDVTSKLPKFGTHHTKMMVNFYRGNTCRIIIHTMNITEADHLLQTQMCWMSPELKFQTDPTQWLDFNQPDISITENTGVAFKRDFIAYLLTYENPAINKLIDQVAKFDFSPIDVVFIASTPGHYVHTEWDKLTKPTAKPMFGYGRLWQIIHMLKLESLSGKFVGQVSTIAGPCDSYQRNILVHLLTSCVEKGFPLIKKANFNFGIANHVDPMIIWPTCQDVLKSKGSALSGIALHFTTNGQWKAYARQFELIKNFFYKWSNCVDFPKQSKAGRSNLSAHVKTYVVTENNFRTLKWFLMTSANLSHQAWGKPNGWNAIDYEICSFEAGVFVDPKLLKIDGNTEHKIQVLVPTYGRDTVEDENSLSGNIFKVGMRLPYDTPLKKYSESDIPWGQPLSNQYF